MRSTVLESAADLFFNKHCIITLFVHISFRLSLKLHIHLAVGIQPLCLLFSAMYKQQVTFSMLVSKVALTASRAKAYLLWWSPDSSSSTTGRLTFLVWSNNYRMNLPWNLGQTFNSTQQALAVWQLWIVNHASHLNTLLYHWNLLFGGIMVWFWCVGHVQSKTGNTMSMAKATANMLTHMLQYVFFFYLQAEMKLNRSKAITKATGALA